MATRKSTVLSEFPTGAHALSLWLYEHLYNNPGSRIDQWSKSEWSAFKSRVIQSLREHKNKLKATPNGGVDDATQKYSLTKGEALRRAKEARPAFDRLIRSIEREVEALHQYINQNRLHSHAIAQWVDDWYKKFHRIYEERLKKKEVDAVPLTTDGMPLITALVSQNLLESANSDQISTHILRDVQQGDRAIYKRDQFDFPASEGRVHQHDPRNAAQYVLQTVPHNQEEETALISWRFPNASEDSRTEIYRQLSPQVQEQVDQAMTRYAKELGDRDADLLTYLMAKFSERAKSETDHITVSLQDLMSFSYSKQGGKSFRIRDEDELRRRVENLQRMTLTIQGNVNGKQYNAQGRLFVIWDRYRHQQRDLHLSDAEFFSRWDEIEYSFGKVWSRRIFQLGGSQIMALQMQALRYDPHKERWEKRLAKYLGPFWRMNVRTNHFFYKRTIRETICDGLTEPLDRFSTRRDVERLEEALDRLVHDGIIESWQYQDDAPRIQGNEDRLQKGWINVWLERSLWIEVPEQLRSYYEKSQPLGLRSNDVIQVDGAYIKRWREQRNLTLRQLASDLGVDPGNLSSMESGKRKVSATVGGKFLEYQRKHRMPAHLRHPKKPDKDI